MLRAFIALAGVSSSACQITWESFLSVNAAYNLETGPRSLGPSASTAFYKTLGPAASLDACATAATIWRNASAPADRCLSAVWLHDPSNATFRDTCWCMPQPKWIPAEDKGADSARLLWPCASDVDCSLNGECNAASGACECDFGWRGPRCGELALGAVDRANPGLREINITTGRNISTWGAPVLFDGATSTWHAWASEMVNECGLNSWRSNSQIVHSTSTDGPLGPWARNEVVQPVFAHEPNVVRGPSGEWVMVWSAFPLPNASSDRCTNCTDGTTSPVYPRGGCGPDAMHGFKQMMAIAQSPAGPWDAFEIPQLSWGWDSNLAIGIRDDGSAVGLIRAGMVWRAPHYANASSWQPSAAPEGPQLPDDTNVEDPFVWLDRKGRFHAVFHNMEPSDGTDYCGIHAFSIDGERWTSGGWSFGGTVNFTDGTQFTFSRRERPHLLFKDDGSLLALSSGAQYGGPFQGDGVFTLINPIVAS